jgi:hypothetical protein
MCQPSRRQGFHRQILDPRAVSKLWHKEARGRGERERERRERERERERERLDIKIYGKATCS